MRLATLRLLDELVVINKSPRLYKLSLAVYFFIYGRRSERERKICLEFSENIHNDMRFKSVQN